MLLLNLSHPLTPAHLARLEELTGAKVARVIEKMPQFEHARPFAEQARELVDGLGLLSTEWQTQPVLLNPPGYAPAALAVIAELHGRMGHFPSIVRLRPLDGSTPTQYEVAEVINLQAVRDAAREKR